MGDEEVKLLGLWASPFSNRVEIALKIKGISYEYVAESIINKSPELLKYNPVHKKLPVLLHNGKPICESLVILEYIDETWESGPSILPQDPYAKAVARFWANFIDDKCIAAMWSIQGRAEGQEKAIEELTEHLKTLENELKGKKFFGGDEIGLVDITANVLAFWLDVVLELLGIELLTREKFPRLCEWIDDYLNNSVIKETLPARDNFRDYGAIVFRLNEELNGMNNLYDSKSDEIEILGHHSHYIRGDFRLLNLNDSLGVMEYSSYGADVCRYDEESRVLTKMRSRNEVVWCMGLFCSRMEIALKMKDLNQEDVDSCPKESCELLEYNHVHKKNLALITQSAEANFCVSAGSLPISQDHPYARVMVQFWQEKYL
ncbi:hypothetical protein POM88_024240 [Heracleum sosnowskyi]|uniref:Probable glutathione S-transferase n=1 Tax=Heracleum sosnowskyi TaxID=360622 RepID=A0AAD8I205_9APIA|nr:hypothetical protein POM88_024240 [Heracleum sosnowskyi]